MAKFGFIGIIYFSYAQGAGEVGFSGQVMNSQCFPKGASNPSDLNVNVLGAMAHGTQDAVPGVLTRIKQLGGGSHLLRGRLTIRMHNGGRATAGGNKTCASFASGSSTVELVQNCRGPSDFNSTAAHLAHEIGHVVGQNGFYGSYGRLPRCNVTRYGSNNDNKNPRNEEFAEVFATYLHAPNYLSSKCPEAFKFLRENVFRFGPNPMDTCTGNPNPLTDGPGANGYGYSDNHSRGALQKGITGSMLEQIQNLNNQKKQRRQKTPRLVPRTPLPYVPQNPAPIRRGPPVDPWPSTVR